MPAQPAQKPGVMGFDFSCPVAMFSKADAPEGRGRRIAGIISTDSSDRSGETILQDGLDFSEFIEHGWYNDNHTKETTGILGYPDSVSQHKAGDPLPDGTVSAENCTWAEGYLLATKKADEIWELGQALQSTGRRLGFSVEGSIDQRKGPGGKVIAKARVRNVALTACPVNVQTRMETLMRSLEAVEKAAEASAGLTIGSARPVANVPRTGKDAGAILTPQSLEGQRRRKRRKKSLHEALTASEANAFVRKQMPGVSKSQASEIIRYTRALKRAGKL